MPTNDIPELLDMETMHELTFAAQAFAIAPHGAAWNNLERAALQRAIARIRLTGEVAKSSADVLLLLEQLSDELR